MSGTVGKIAAEYYIFVKKNKKNFSVILEQLFFLFNARTYLTITFNVFDDTLSHNYI